MAQSSMNMRAYVVEGELRMNADTDPLHPDISTTIPDENEGETDPRHTAVERVLRLLLLMTANEYTRLEIFERLASYYNVDNIATSSDSCEIRSIGKKY